jgi:hypothetical protein
MKIRSFPLLQSVLATAILLLGYTASAQRARLGKVQSLQATSEKDGQHPASANITAPASITCLNATSEVPNGKPTPSCRIIAPGFNGSLKIGQKISMTDSGTVTLTCNGQGPMLRCTARVDIPPPAH